MVQKIDDKVNLTPYYENKPNISDIIFILLYRNSRTNIKDEMIKDASEFIIKILMEKGKFLNSNLGKYYYVSKERIILNLDTDEFKIYLSKLTGINKVNSAFKYFLSSVEDNFLENSKKVDIHKFNYYNKVDNILYINNNNGNITKISINGIDEIKNGDDDILFLTESQNKAWNITKMDHKKISYFGGNSDKSFINQLLDSLSIKEGRLSVDEQKILLRSYFYSIFFNNLFNSKPLLSLIGGKGSGKSFFLEMIQKVVIGKKDLISIPKNEKNLNTNLINGYLNFYDNVDSHIKGEMIDSLCIACNGGNIKFRKLYSNGEEIEKKVNCFIAITSRTPHFQRDDLSDRSLKIDFNRRENYNLTSDEIYDNIDQNYDYIMSELMYEIQKIITILNEYKNFDTSFRMNEFAKFTYNIFKDQFSSEKIYDLFEKVKKTQEDFSNSDDDLLELLDSIFDIKNQKIFDKDSYYTAKQIHEKLFYFQKNNSYLNYTIKNANCMGISLTQKYEEYKEMGIEIKTNSIKTGNKKSYRIRKIKSN